MMSQTAKSVCQSSQQYYIKHTSQIFHTYFEFFFLDQMQDVR